MGQLVLVYALILWNGILVILFALALTILNIVVMDLTNIHLEHLVTENTLIVPVPMDIIGFVAHVLIHIIQEDVGINLI